MLFLGWHLSSLHPQLFSDVAYKARDREDLIAGIDEFLDEVIVLPPGEWDPNIRIEPPKKVPSAEKRWVGDTGLVPALWPSLSCPVWRCWRRTAALLAFIPRKKFSRNADFSAVLVPRSAQHHYCSAKSALPPWAEQIQLLIFPNLPQNPSCSAGGELQHGLGHGPCIRTGLVG